jgi:TonB-linked SusC/RagA family outer membrane protein
MTAFTICTMAVAHTNYAQLLDRKITVNLVSTPFPDALHIIEREAGLKFIYSLDQLRKEKDVSLQADQESLRAILQELFSFRNMRFTVHEKEGSITLKKVHNPLKENQSLQMDAARPSHVIEIKGLVRDGTTTEPMAGVNVVVSGTTIGTTTDGEGNFSIQADKRDVLVFSFIGYTTMEVLVGEQTRIDITLQQDIQNLDEVIVQAGYWQVNDRERTGNIGRITSKEIQKQAVTSPLQALQGRIPGLYVQQQTGLPGGAFTVRVRGQNSLRADGNEPLYIVDGMTFPSVTLSSSAGAQILPGSSPLHALNPNDIESIEVLKDADATAIYGSRGSNGVILITTRKGKAGRTLFDLQLYRGFSNVTRKMDLLDTRQYLQMRKEAFRNDETTMTVANARDLMLWDTTRHTDWQEELIGGTAHIHNAQLSLSGGEGRTQFFIGAGLIKQTTVFPGDFSDLKISGHFNLNHTSSNEKFKISLTTSYLQDRNNLVKQDITSYITLAPNSPEVYDSAGNLNWEKGTWFNPYSVLQRPYEGRNNNLITSATLSYKLLPSLQLKGNLGYNAMDMQEFSAFPISSWDPGYSINTGTSIFSENKLASWNIEPQLEYEKNLGQGKFNALLGATLLQTTRTGESILGDLITSDVLLKNLQAAPYLQVLDYIDSKYKYAALFARLNYNWKEKYILNLTGRRDGSSRFGPDRRFASFGAVGAAWIFSEENFIQSLSWFTFGKLRTSYGITGNDQVGDYGFMDTYTSYAPYQEANTLIPARLANADYSWETNKKYEAGLELGFLKDQVNVSVSWFRNRSSNQLVGYSLPTLTGFNSVQYNLPATVENRGWEILLNSTPIQRTHFQWHASINFTLPRNTLVTYPDLEASSYAYRYQVGESLFIRKAYHYTGVDPQTGLYTFEDVNNNGSGTDYPADLQGLYDLTQEFYGGINNQFQYSDFQVSFLLQFVSQRGTSYMNSSNFFAPGILNSSMGNQPVEVMRRWQQEGDAASVQRFTQQEASMAGSLFNNGRSSGDISFTDASFLRLQNIHFSWKLPSSLLRKAHLNDCRVIMQGQNLFTWTNYIGLDPENQSAAVLPPLRTLTLGVQLSL